MAKKQEQLFDTKTARAAIEKGRRYKWWKRTGTKARGFKYVDVNGRRLTDELQLDRITSLVIPPAWKYVRISPAASSKIQAVGMDTTGRVQYIYHSKYAEKREREKFAKLIDFAEQLPQLRKATNADMMLDGLPKSKVLATMLHLINSLYFRMGSEKSATLYRTFGITTLKNEHLHLGRNGTLTFDFVGKSHVRHRKIMVDKEMAEVMAELKKIGPKRKLFCYINDEGKARPVRPSEINAYIKEATQSAFSSKDFRTWGASVLAATSLAELGASVDESEIKKNIVKAVKLVAEELGNTPAVCRSSYIHPFIIKSYEKGMTIDDFTPRKTRRIKRIQSHYEPGEAALLKMLKSNGK